MGFSEARRDVDADIRNARPSRLACPRFLEEPDQRLQVRELETRGRSPRLIPPISAGEPTAALIREITEVLPGQYLRFRLLNIRPVPLNVLESDQGDQE